MATLDDLLKRPSGVETDAVAEENIEDRGGWGLLRGVRDRALALELRKKDDTILAVPFNLIEQFLYAPDDGITLRVSGREIRIRGRHLAGPSSRPLNLFTALTRHRVPYIAEHARTDGPLPPGATLIEVIQW